MKKEFFRKFLWLTIVFFIPSSLQAKDVISILYFENTTQKFEYDWMRKGIADMLMTDIKKSDQIEVVERENLERVLQEHKLVLSGLTDPSQVFRVGRLLKANKLVYGSYIIMDETIRLDARITDVETGKIAQSINVSGRVRDLFSLEKKLAEKIFTHLTLKTPSEIEIQETDSFEALKTYYEGISLLDGGEVEKAVMKFRKAGQLDPFYQKPQKSLEDAYQFLKDYKSYRRQREIRNLYLQADKIRNRLRARKWTTYAEIVRSKSPGDLKRFERENPEYLLCDTPAQCTWVLMYTLRDIGNKYREYFNDIENGRRLDIEVFQIAERARDVFKKDPFFAHILFEQLGCLARLEDYNKLKTYAEEFLLKYPEYFMIESVEKIYERTLSHLKK